MRREKTCRICRVTFATGALYEEHSCGELTCPGCSARVVLLAKVVQASCSVCGFALEPRKSRDKSPGQRGVDFADSAQGGR